jgi:Uma2 family endonuclease
MNEHVKLGRPRPTTQAADGLPRWRWTTAELLRLVEVGVLDADEKFELIGGEIVPMSPRGRRHEVIADELAQYWHPLAPPDVRIGVERQFNLDDATFTDPDLLVRPAHIKSYDLRGETALLVVEVADTSWKKDTGIKAGVYAAFGVREYWVINAETLVTLVHRAPAAGVYTSIVEVPAGETLTPELAQALSVRLAALDL